MAFHVGGQRGGRAQTKTASGVMDQGDGLGQEKRDRGYCGVDREDALRKIAVLPWNMRKTDGETT